MQDWCGRNGGRGRRQRAVRRGARVRRKLRVDRIDVTGDGVTVVAGDLECRARHAVISAGTWLGNLMPELRLPLRVTRQVLGWFPIERPEQFAPERFPVFLRDIGDHSHPDDVVATDSTFYGFPSLDRRTIKIAIHREGPAADPDALDRTATPDELADIGRYVELLPARCLGNADRQPRVHVHQHAGPRLPRRVAGRDAERHHPRRVLRARLQVRLGDGRDRRRPLNHRT